MKKLFLALIVSFQLFYVAPVFAADYTLLAPLPLSGPGSQVEKTSATTYLEGMFKLLIGVAGALAVVMIIVGGIKYMSSDAIGGKSEAKETIQNAIWGLILAIGAWLILNTINPDLVKFNLNLDKITATQDTTAPGTNSGTGVGGGGGGGGGGI